MSNGTLESAEQERSPKSKNKDPRQRATYCDSSYAIALVTLHRLTGAMETKIDILPAIW